LQCASSLTIASFSTWRKNKFHGYRGKSNPGPLLLVHCLKHYGSSEVFIYMICFILDPLYTLSSDRDHARSTFKAHTGTDRIVSGN